MFIISKRFVVLILILSIFAYCPPAQLLAKDQLSLKKTPRQLLKNGDFEIGDKTPKYWNLIDKKWTHWTNEGVGESRYLKFTLTKAIAETNGVRCYSDFIPVKPGILYRFSADVKTEKPTPMLFVKGYAEIERKIKQGKGGDITVKVKKVREVVRKSSLTCSTANAKEWKRYRLHFFFAERPDIITTKPLPKWVKVMLYAYYPPGDVYFDKAKFEEIGPYVPPKRSKQSDEQAISRPSPEQLYWKAISHWQKKAYSQALNILEEAIQTCPNNPEYHLLRGRLYFRMNLLPEAEMELHHTLALKPEKRWIVAWSHIALGWTYDKAGKRDEAVLEYKKALDLNASQNANKTAQDGVRSK